MGNISTLHAARHFYLAPTTDARCGSGIATPRIRGCRMAWFLVAALCALVVLLVALYRRALADTRHIFSLLTLVLLDDSVRIARKADLVNFVRSSKTQGADQLSSEVFNSLCDVSNRLARTSVLSAQVALWQLREKP